jgi:hypothetical protein
VKVRDLGPLLVELGESTVAMGTSRQAALLCRLAKSASQWVPAHTLAQAAWDTAEEVSTAGLNSQLWRLRNLCWSRTGIDARRRCRCKGRPAIDCCSTRTTSTRCDSSVSPPRSVGSASSVRSAKRAPASATSHPAIRFCGSYEHHQVVDEDDVTTEAVTHQPPIHEPTAMAKASPPVSSPTRRTESPKWSRHVAKETETEISVAASR